MSSWPQCIDDDERERRLHALRSMSVRQRLSLGRDEAQSRARGPVVRIDGSNPGPDLGETWDEPTGSHVASSADFDLPDDHRSFARWPATLHPDAAERCYYSAREASLRWVAGLRTRSGTLRSGRIRRCGDPVAVMRVGDGACAWEHRWCRDRACFACAKSRSRRLATDLRSAIETRPHATRLYFVTLTQPRLAGESCTASISRWMRCWTALRHHPIFRDIAGGVRVTEVTYSLGHKHARQQIAGWHVHGHLIVELKHDAVFERCPTCAGSKLHNNKRCGTCGSSVTMPRGELPDVMVAFINAWCSITRAKPSRGAAGPSRPGAVSQAQCAVPLNPSNVGQLAKYLTKLWELQDTRARELFAAAAGRRIVDGFGSWRGWRRFSCGVERTPHGWLSSQLPVRAIEALDRDAAVEFARPCGVTMEADGRPRWRPQVVVARTTAGAILDALRRDPRPVWERVTGPPPEATLVAVERIADAVRQQLRHEHRGALGPARID